MTMKRWQAYFPADLLARVDAWAARHKARNRATAVRDLLARGLEIEREKTWRLELDRLLAVTGADDYLTALRMARRTLAHINEG